MPSRHRNFTGKAIERRIAQGRGSGEGINYSPWIQINEIPAHSTCSQITGWRHGRNHHLLSKKEQGYFYLLEWSDSVAEIREQFPLFPLEETVEIARALGVKHPSHRGLPVVMTSDFLILKRDIDGIKPVARTVKPLDKLNGKRTIEKLEIERVYYQLRGIDWKVVTDSQISPDYTANIRYVHSAYRYPGQDSETSFAMLERLDAILTSRGGRISLSELGQLVDKALDSDYGQGLRFIRFLMSRKILACDMLHKIYPTKPIDLTLKVIPDDFGGLF